MRTPVFHFEQAPIQILCSSGEGCVKNIWPFRRILHPPVSWVCMFRVCHHLVVYSASVGTLCSGGECLVPDNLPEPLPMSPTTHP